MTDLEISVQVTRRDGTVEEEVAYARPRADGECWEVFFDEKFMLASGDSFSWDPSVLYGVISRRAGGKP